MLDKSVLKFSGIQRTTGSAKRLIPYYTVPLSTLPGNLRPLTQRWAGGWPGVGGLTSRCPGVEFAVHGSAVPPVNSALRSSRSIPVERYADDIVCHFYTQREKAIDTKSLPAHVKPPAP